MSDCEHPPICPVSCSHCLAFDRITRTLCSTTPSSGSKWCLVHEELQAKLLKTYKRCSLAVKAFDDTTIPSSTTILETVNDLIQLSEWSEKVRIKWSLTFRASHARSNHHDQFYAGGDLGHCYFVDNLKEESLRLEKLLQALDKRAYDITLSNSQAEWILAPPSSSFICDEKPSISITSLPTPPTTPIISPINLPLLSSSANKNQRKKAQRKNRNKLQLQDEDQCCPSHSIELEPLDAVTLLNQLRSYLIPPSSLHSSVSSSTWYSTISTLYRYVILRIPSLALLALDSGGINNDIKTFTTVESFLNFLERRAEDCCVTEVKKLWTGMNFTKSVKEDEDENRLLGVGVLRDAIAEVFRTEKEEESSGKFVELLGGKVYKEANDEELPEEGWNLFYQFIGCYGCSLSVTHTFTGLSRNRQLALLGSFPDYMDRTESTSETKFRRLGIIIATSNSTTFGKKVKRIIQKGGVKSKPVTVETWERPWIYLQLPLGESSIQVVKNLIPLTQLEILARNLFTGEMLNVPIGSRGNSCGVKNCDCCDASDLWLSKVRSGTNISDRKSSQFSTSTFFPGETVLDSLKKCSSPENRFDRNYTDLIDVLILDNSDYNESGDWDTFVEDVANKITRSIESSYGMISEGGKKENSKVLVKSRISNCDKIRNMFKE